MKTLTAFDSESSVGGCGDKVISLDEFTSKEIYYYKSITDTFKGELLSDVQRMVDIVKGRSSISLRVLDWFVTKYSDVNGTSYKLPSFGDEEFIVFIGYKAQLRAHRKRYFDPFRRRDKFYYECSGERLLTTIGQLNFFRWAFANGVVDYVGNHLERITKAMNKVSRGRKGAGGKAYRHPRSSPRVPSPREDPELESGGEIIVSFN